LNAFEGALAHVQEQVLKAEEERLQKAEEERARKAEGEQLRRAKEEQALKAEIERLQRAEVERARKAEEERLRRAKEEQALKAEIERLQRVEAERARKTEEERIQRVETTASSQEPVLLDEEDEKVSFLPSRLWGNRPDTPPPARQTLNDEEDLLSALPASPVPIQPVPQTIVLPMPRAQSKPHSASLKRPLSSRTGGKMQQQAPAQKPRTGPTMRNGSRVPQSVGSRPVAQSTHRGPTDSRSAPGTSMRRPATQGRSGRPRRLYLTLISIVAILIILLGVFYLNTTSTVQITITTQDYTHAVTLTLSEQKQAESVPVKSITREFTQTVSEPATGSTMQGVDKATGTVYFTNTGTTSVQIAAQTVLATKNSVNFVTTANVLILPQSANPPPIPVSIEARDEGPSGNVAAGSITVIPPESLASIAQAPQSQAVTVESLKTTLTVSNPDPTTGGDAHPVAAVAQQDLDKAKNDLDKQVQADIDAWKQTMTKNGLVGQPVITEKQVNAPAVDTSEPNKTFSATTKVTAKLLIAQPDDVQRVALSQLHKAVQADKQLGPTFAVIGDDPHGIKIDLAQQSAGNGNTVTVPGTAKIGHPLNITDIQNSIRGTSPNEARTILLQKRSDIQTVDTQTQPTLFNWEVSPWADHIHVIVLPAVAKT
jgi:hypothetical protein